MLALLWLTLRDTDSLQRSFFCFRRDDVYEQMDSTHRSQYCETNGVARQHLAELKGKIADTMHTHRLDHNVMSYGCGWDGQRLTGLDELVNFLSTALVQEILLYESEDSSDNHEDEFEQLNALTLQHVEASNRLFCGREDWLQWLNEYIDRHDRALLMVAGNDGLGKTATRYTTRKSPRPSAAGSSSWTAGTSTPTVCARPATRSRRRCSTR